MKLINKLDETNDKSLYSGKSTASVEMYLRPIPAVDNDGNPIKPVKRYYIFRLLNFQTEERKYPFIVRNEHEYFQKDSNNKVIGVKRICCPTTLWASHQLKESVADPKHRCPICNLSYEQNSEAWKSFKSTGKVDTTSLQISKDTRARWAAYIPVRVAQDPAYERNNNHFRVLRLSGDEGQSTFNRIRSIINEANEKGINVFNGEEGANIAILCEKQEKLMTDKKGNPVFDPATGEQRTYKVNAVTDVRLLSSKLKAYSDVTEANLEKLEFDETYGVAATRDQLNVFMNENYLDTGATDADFGDDFNDDDFSEPAPKKQTATTTVAQKPQTVRKPAVEEADEIEEEVAEEETEVFTADDLEEDVDESPKAAIARITKGKIAAPKATAPQSRVTMASRAELPPDTESLRQTATDFDDEDLPF